MAFEGEQSSNYYYYYNNYSEQSDYSNDEADDDDDQQEEEVVVLDENKVPRFLYDRSLLLPFLPCFLFLLSLTGKWYLALIAVMALFVYLLDLAEEKQLSLTVAIICIFVSQIYVLCSVLPLMWSCWMNAFLVLLTNLFTALTGGWVALQFSNFIKNDYKFAKALEVSLFTVYPVVCCGMMTWWLASLTHVQLAPYYFAFLGFILLQLFLYPAPSSFGPEGRASSVRTDPILEPETVATLVSAYVVSPALIYIVTTLYCDYYGFFDLSTLGTLIFVAMTSVFLSTHLNIKTFIEHFVIEKSVIVWLRWVSGIGALLTMGVIIRTLELSTKLLPWLPFATALHVTLGCSLSYKKTRKFGLPSALVVLMFYTASLYLLPSSQIVHGLYMSPLYGAVCLHMALVLASILLMANPLYVTLANTCLVFALAIFTVLEVVLFCADLFGVILCAVTCAICAYVAPRLHHVDKLTPLSCQLILALSVSKLLIIFQYKYLPLVGSISWFMAVGATTPLVFLCIRFVFFTHVKTMTDRTKLLYAGGLVAFLCLSAPTMLNSVYKAVMNDYASYDQLLVLFLFVLGLLCLKWTVCRQCALVYRNHAPALIITSLVTLIAKTQVRLVNGSSLLDVWFVAAIFTCAHTLCGSFASKRLRSLATLSLAIGLPVGNKIVTLVHDQHESVVMRVSSMGVYTCVVFIMFVLRYTEHKLVTRRLVNTALVQFVLWTAMIVLELDRTPPALLLVRPVTWSVLVTCLLPAVACKIYSLSGKTLVLSSHVSEDGDRGWFYLLANAYTATSFVLACLICPVQQWDVWCCLCSSILLLLHKDGRLISSAHRRPYPFTPALTSALAFIFVSTLRHNILWYPGDVKRSWFNVGQGLLELVSLTFTLPNIYQLLGLLWKNTLLVNERLIVFLAPLYALHIYGGSYQSWAMGAAGALSNGWMIMYRFPLVPDKIVFHRRRLMRQRQFRR